MREVLGRMPGASPHARVPLLCTPQNIAVIPCHSMMAKWMLHHPDQVPIFGIVWLMFDDCRSIVIITGWWFLSLPSVHPPAAGPRGRCTGTSVPALNKKLKTQGIVREKQQRRPPSKWKQKLRKCIRHPNTRGGIHETDGWLLDIKFTLLPLITGDRWLLSLEAAEHRISCFSSSHYLLLLLLSSQVSSLHYSNSMFQLSCLLYLINNNQKPLVTIIRHCPPSLSIINQPASTIKKHH